MIMIITAIAAAILPSSAALKGIRPLAPLHAPLLPHTRGCRGTLQSSSQIRLRNSTTIPYDDPAGAAEGTQMARRNCTNLSTQSRWEGGRDVRARAQARPNSVT